ncbi:hypothetical protein HNP84_009865 [Thermocatellispora tengchongensis]|uniref:Uncharacterized protein n=2 Tax=Thermocatellispora tengchongensis TaxID=1073253 RepID=A0A840PQP9_9ACTN|nr:hypothetical protein [Thermocatellispora tengchongensis]MBB5140100.1 hypothetical protein [Thermocatellispora tengchongensis]
MSAEGVEHALRQRRAEFERLSGDLLDLESHSGYLLLKGAELTGETKRRWERAEAGIATLWWLFDAFRRTLEKAEEVRARRPRPGAAELAELTALLTGPSVEMKVEDVPVERRSLVRAAAEWLTLDQVLRRMDDAYRESAQTIAAVDSAWTVLAPRVNAAEAVWDSARRLAEELGEPDPELVRLGEALVALRDAARSDPLTYATGDPRELAEMDRFAAELADRRGLLEQAVRIKAGYAERVAALAARLDEVERAELAVVEARDLVLIKIANPVLPAMPDQARTLRDRLDALDGLRGAGDWTDLARRMTELERAADEALAQARATAEAVTGLIARRDELRGRLEAFKAKAVRLGRAEDAELGYLYRRAHDLLWTAPCDLRQSTVAVAGYQRAISQTGAGG